MSAILLTGAALVGLPILLHLIMRQEPKKLPFPAFRFLKMRSKTNQRKMRLRHFLLLFMRMLLIGLITLALFQPTLLSDRFNIKGEQPLACVLVIDTSPSMGYVLADRSGLSEERKRGLKLLEETEQGPWTALDDARFRAMELLEDLPPNSKVAVIDTADRDANWVQALPDARKKIRELKRPRASSRSVSQTLELAYKLFARTEQDASPGQENMPRLLAVFSDRTAPSWDESQVPTLKELRDKKSKDGPPPPEIHAAYIDVGVERPLNLAITGIEMKPQIVSANRPIEFSVLLEAFGSVQENTVQVRFDDETETLKQAVRVEPGAPREVTFRKEGLKPGLHEAEITLQTADALPTDNVRFLTFRVREPRKILLIADAGVGLGAVAGGLGMIDKLLESTLLWRIALEATDWYSCETASTSEFLTWKPGRVEQFEAVILAGVTEPTTAIWDRLASYVEGSGGQLIVVPGGSGLLTDGADKPPPGYDHKLLPGRLKQWIEVDRAKPVAWAWEALTAHPMLTYFKESLKNPNIDFVLNRPQTWGYWEVEARDRPSVLVSYADDPDADKRRPAVLEQTVGTRGRVLLFTSPMDGRYKAGSFRQQAGYTNDYAATGFFVALSNLAMRYLTGDNEDAVFNFLNGQSVIIRWPLDAANRSKTYFLYGPDIGDRDAVLTRDNKDAFRRLGPDLLKSAGNYKIISDPSDKKPDLKPWREGFSLNAPADESNLERVPVESIEALFGPKSVAAADKERKLRDILRGKFSAPIELFPFLMILLLLFLALENLLSNKFYRQVKKEPAA